MKITILISSLSRGGAERVACNLANYLVGKGHQVDILSVSEEQTYHIDDNVNHVCLYREINSKLPHLVINILRYRNFLKYIKSVKRDIYISFLPGQTALLLKHKALLNTPVIAAERCDPRQRSIKDQKRILKSYQKADGYVFQTEEAKKYYEEEGLDLTYSAVIPNAINPEFLSRKIHKDREPIIVGAGRLSDQKNFSLLIRAFAVSSKEVDGYKLKIFGEGPLLQELKDLAISLDVQDKVLFEGYVPDLAEHIKKASVYVLSSNYEGMPNALAEAMALGIPCISTDCSGGGSKFLINDGVDGVLVPVNDVQSMANAITKLLKDREYAEHLAENAILIGEKLAPEKIYAKWEKFIKDVQKDKSK